MQASFHQHSGRVISLGRVGLAFVFLLAIWFDPSQPSKHFELGYILLALYLAVAIIHLVSTWNNWWREHRLALAAHALDIVMFGVMVYLTEGYTSPFFTFFVFIVLSSAIKWGWRETAATAAVVISIFFIAGYASLAYENGEMDIQRLMFRSIYVIVLSIVMIWFGLYQRASQVGRAPLTDLAEPANPSAPSLTRIALFAAGRLGARRAWVLLRGSNDLIWSQGLEYAAGDIAEIDVDALPQPGHSHAAMQRPYLYDFNRRRILRMDPNAARALADEIPKDVAGLADVLDLGDGLCIPIETDRHSGLVFLADISGLCADHLPLADGVALEISRVLERDATTALSLENAATMTRLALTRDLHDNFVQVLVGTSFRLEGMRRAVKADRDIASDLDDLKEVLARGQKDLREFIGKIRHGPTNEASGGLLPFLQRLATRLSDQWDIRCELDSCPGDLSLPEDLSHGIEHMMREAVANAVRHGKADWISVAVRRSETLIVLTCRDNGSGFPDLPDGVERHSPWSLKERASECGGKLDVTSSATGSCITVEIPFKDGP